VPAWIDDHGQQENESAAREGDLAPAGSAPATIATATPSTLSTTRITPTTSARRGRD
jgi:hypothetical protein